MNYNKIIKWLSYSFFFFSLMTGSSILFTNFSNEGYKSSPIAPPPWFFYFIWTTLFFLIGLSLRRLYKLEIKNNKLSTMTWLFITQLITNILWGMVFGLTRSLVLSPIILLFTWYFILATIIELYKIDKVSAHLMIPYLCWVNAAVIVSIGTAIYN